MFATTDLSDDHPDARVMDTILRSYGSIQQFAGPIETVRVDEDNVLVVEAIEAAPEGSVIVVDGGGSPRCALVGDRIATIALERGLAGVVVFGCVRDTIELAQLDIGVLALGTSPRRSKKKGEGDRDVEVSFGGIAMRPGDFLYSDVDGIVVASDPLI